MIVDGTSGDDAVTVAGDSTGVSVQGLAVRTRVTNAESTDALRVNGLEGNGVISASGLAANALTRTEEGGDGDDVLIGGPGTDVLDGGPGANLVIQ